MKTLNQYETNMKNVKSIFILFTLSLIAQSCRKNQIERLDGYRYELIEYKLGGSLRNNDISEFSFTIEKGANDIGEITLKTNNSYGITDNGDSVITSLGYVGQRKGIKQFLSLDINMNHSEISYKRSRNWIGNMIFEEREEYELGPFKRYLSSGRFSIDHKKDEFVINIDFPGNELVSLSDISTEDFTFKRTKL